jgi:hypothetical protein
MVDTVIYAVGNILVEFAERLYHVIVPFASGQGPTMVPVHRRWA